MQKKFNDVVILSKNGVLVPAIVIKSQLQGDGREFLSLLYADPSSGPSLVIAGATRKVGSVELTVQPLVKGAAYGWLDYTDDAAEVLTDHAEAVQAGEKPETVDFQEHELPGVHGLPQQSDETDAEKAARLANLAHQDPAAQAKETAPELEVVKVPVPEGEQNLLAPEVIAEEEKHGEEENAAQDETPAS